MTDLQWRIEDPWFHPLGLNTDASPTKVVFVTWTFDYLLSFVFKKQPDQSPILTEIIKIPTKGTAKTIKVLKSNTFVLMEGTGELHYFKSTRTLETIPTLSDVRCISCGANGGFSVIRVLEDKRINLEVYNDFEDIADLEVGAKKYDITFDEENVCESSWKDEQFTIESIVVDDTTLEFFALLTKNTNLSVGQEVHIFTVSNNLFCLCPENDIECDIIQISTVASDIIFVKKLASANILLVFLACGVIEILFKSQMVKMIDKSTHVTGASFKSWCFSDISFYYSDKYHIGKLDFEYDDILHTCVVKTDTQKATGVVALVWSDAIRKLVCLSENNIFYRIRFKPQLSQTISNMSTMYELTSEKISQIESDKRKIESSLGEPERIRKAIEEEILKQEILAIATKTDLYSKLFECRVSIHAEKHRIGCYAEIIINAKETDIFETVKWKLMIHLKFVTDNICVCFPFGKEHVNKSTIFYVTFKKENLQGSINPIIEFTTDITVEGDHLTVTIPVQVIDLDYKGLFSDCIRNVDEQDLEWEDVLSNINNQISEKRIYKSNIKTPVLLSFKDVYQFFDFPIPNDENTSLKAYLFDSCVTIDYNENSNFVTISADKPISAFYAKVVIAKGLYSGCYDVEPVKDVEERKIFALKLLAQLDGLDAENDDQEYVKSTLLEIYNKKRKEYNN